MLTKGKILKAVTFLSFFALSTMVVSSPSYSKDTLQQNQGPGNMDVPTNKGDMVSPKATPKPTPTPAPKKIKHKAATEPNPNSAPASSGY